MIAVTLRGLACAIAALLAATCLAIAPAAAQADSPALWKIDAPPGKVYLFGAFHMLPAGVEWRTAALQQAFDEAKVVVFETDLEQANDQRAIFELIAKYGVLPKGRTLEDVLPAAVRADLKTTTAQLGVPPEVLAPLRPWMAGLTLAVQFLIQQGFDPENGMDRLIAASAKAQGKEMATLETNELQIRIFADLSPEQEVAFLAASLRQIHETPQLLDEMLAAYRRGDVAALAKLADLGFDDFPELRERIMGGRHLRWLPQIDRMLAEGRTCLIVVGAAHLAGPDGLVEMLRAKGLKVVGP